MALVGILLFCEDCGSILDRCIPAQRTITCSLCTKPNPNNWPTTQTIKSTETAFPSNLRDKRSNIQTLTVADREIWAMTPKPCPKCGHHETRFHDVQLRGADEGTTIFYKCPGCDHSFNENN